MLKTILIILLISQLFTNSALANERVTMSQAQLLSLMAAPSAPKMLILDVRSAEEFTGGHIAGAVNISHDQIAQAMPQVQSYQHELVVVYCRSGRRAAVAEAVLAEHSFDKIYHLDGDMNAWAAQHLPMVPVK